VPVMYTFLDDLGSWVSARLTSASDHDAAIPTPAPAPGRSPAPAPAPTAGD